MLDIHTAHHKKVQCTVSGCSIDSGIDLGISCFPMELKQRERDFDLIIEVEDHSIPVHSSILSEYSAAIGTMMEALSNNPKENDKEPTNICLRGHSVKDVKDLLDFAYFPDREIDDSNVLDALEIAENFIAETLTRRCEDFLISNDDYHPLDIIPVATRYNLKRLLAYSIKEACKIPRIQCYSDFDELGYSTQSKILRQLQKQNVNYSKEGIAHDFPKEVSQDGYVSLAEEDEYDADSESE